MFCKLGQFAKIGEKKGECPLIYRKTWKKYLQFHFLLQREVCIEIQFHHGLIHLNE